MCSGFGAVSGGRPHFWWGLGGFVEYFPLEVNPNRPYRLPETISFEEGAMMEPQVAIKILLKP